MYREPKLKIQVDKKSRVCLSKNLIDYRKRLNISRENLALNCEVDVKYLSRIENDVMTDNGKHNLGEILENGSGRMAPRPHHDRILQHAEKEIVRIYDQSYFNEEEQS